MMGLFDHCFFLFLWVIGEHTQPFSVPNLLRGVGVFTSQCFRIGITHLWIFSLWPSDTP